MPGMLPSSLHGQGSVTRRECPASQDIRTTQNEKCRENDAMVAIYKKGIYCDLISSVPLNRAMVMP